MADRETELLIIGARHCRPGDSVGGDATLPRHAHHRSGERKSRCRSPDRTQQWRHSLRPLLQDGIAEGAQLRGGRGVNETLLPGARHCLRRVRQAGGGNQRGRGAAAGGAASARQSRTACRDCGCWGVSSSANSSRTARACAHCTCRPPALSTTPPLRRSTPS